MGSGPEALYSQQACGGSGSFGGDASFTALWKGPSDAAAPPIVSAGMIATHASTPGSKLYDLDPGSGVPRYAETLPSPAIDHFGSPSAGGGGLFLASGSSVTAYRIAVPPPGAAPLGEPAGPPFTLAASAPQRRGAGTPQRLCVRRNAALSRSLADGGEGARPKAAMRAPGTRSVRSSLVVQGGGDPCSDSSGRPPTAPAASRSNR